MSPIRSRLRRERRTIEAMVTEYCRGHHDAEGEHCSECAELLSYAERRLEKCPFQEQKPPCTKCPIHCYQPARREQIKAVMRYSGPRMMLRHPLFALRHWLDGFKKVPPKPKRRARVAASVGPPPGAAPGPDEGNVR